MGFEYKSLDDSLFSEESTLHAIIFLTDSGGESPQDTNVSASFIYLYFRNFIHLFPQIYHAVPFTVTLF